MKKSDIDFITPFSPTIMVTKVPEKFINLINKIGDDVLSDDKKSAQFDWSGHLVGKVHKEVQIPMVKQEEADYCKDILKGACVNYLKELISKGRAYIDNMILHHPKHGNLHPTDANINISQSWIVSQYKGEYNPWHKHSGNFSAVLYLKIPEGMNDFMEKEYEDHYPSSGLIQFMYGESQDFRSDTLTCLPEVGKMYLFPSWLKHSVYPFYCEGERRSLSFNAFFRK